MLHLTIPSRGNNDEVEKLLTVEQIRVALADRVLSRVALETGITRQTLAKLRESGAAPSYKTLVALSDYLERPL